jgi:valyl-tRNA synthetase
MNKKYYHEIVEKKWIDYWIKNKTFSSDVDETKKPFIIFIPPANITGSLHIGHALNATLQDIIIRFKKIAGYNTLWIPGIDHGGIATQNVVEKILKKKGKTRHDLGREKFLKEMWKWRKNFGNIIFEQLKIIGCSFDWDRIAFTMDNERSKIVKKAFIELFNKGLIYRGKRLINWCHRCYTAISDIEVEYENEKSKLWYIKYNFTNDKNQYIVIATTRPETIFGDVALAVNPDDKRYNNFINNFVDLPLTNRKIKIISDYIVDKSFGTGVIKVTPAHDPVDNDIANRNNLEILEIIDNNAKIINVSNEYNGLSINDARKKVIDNLYKNGNLLKSEEYLHSIGKCYRCLTNIEFLMSEQWFLKVKEMSKKAIDVVNNGEIVFYPSSWVKPYVLWLKKIKDWCISRQILWGHRIPVYYCINKKNRKNCKPIASFNMPKHCPICNGKIFIQDEDVIDTWFSSALWPISIFNFWDDCKKNKTNIDFEYFFPTSVLVTGYEIIYLWVARMIQFSLEFTKKIPFGKVYIHGIIRDKQGKKMSKSLGNVIDPTEIIKKYGADALRFTLASVSVSGRDMQISEELFVNSRNFVNKIWNAARFLIMNLDDFNYDYTFNNYFCDFADSWIIFELNNIISEINILYDSYKIGAITRIIYDFFWTKYCDWYIEFSKVKIQSIDTFSKKKTIFILLYVFKYILQLLHPIIPFITSEIWSALNKKNKTTKDDILIPITKLSNINNDNDIIKKMEVFQNIIIKIRTLRNEMNIPCTAKIDTYINILNNYDVDFIKKNEEYIKKIAKIKSIVFSKNIIMPKNSVSIMTKNFEIFLCIDGFIDIDKEKNRLMKNIVFGKKEIDMALLKLKNKNFIKNAPEYEIEKIKSRLYEAKLKVERIKKNLNFL